jgi:MFS transporter, PAT family, beta-lactamase induction signal transducer AmpG
LSESTETPRKSWGEALAVYLTPRQLIILFMGFASGLPLLLTLTTLSYWLSTVGVSKTSIGLFLLVGAPYTFKFLWSPLIDQISLPILGRWLGRRRSWLIACQALLAISIFAMGQTNPVEQTTLTAIAALAVAFFSASQDIVIDAYRIELLGPEEQGAGAATTQVGYRFGMILAGAGAVAMSDTLPWAQIFAILAAVMLGCAVLTLFLPEPKITAVPVQRRDYATFLRQAVIEPFKDFATRSGWVVILLFILLYKFGDAFGGAMATPFYRETGFTGTEIALITKVYGIAATLIGGLVGGAMVARFGLFKTLLLGGLLQALTNLLFSALAWREAMLTAQLWSDFGPIDPPIYVFMHAIYHEELVHWLMAAITLDNVTGGIASAALIAYLSGLCNVAYTATQYALFSSIVAYGRTVMSSGSGWLIDAMDNDWTLFWALTTFMAVPGLLLLLWITRLYPNERKLVPGQAPAA